MVTWSVDTLPQLFEVTTFTHLRQSTQPHMDWITFVSDGFWSMPTMTNVFTIHGHWSIGHLAIAQCTFPISKAAGYKVDVLEYHDAKGDYYKANYSEESGRVSRCHEKSAEKEKNSTNDRTPANDVRNRGEHIDGWAFDPDWVKGSVQMASLVFDATKPMECPMELL